MITSTARDYIQPDKISEYKKLITELIDKTRTEPGNISYTLFSDIENAGEFVLIEEWHDMESLEKHFETEHFKKIVPEIKKIHVKPSSVNIYQNVY